MSQLPPPPGYPPAPWGPPPPRPPGMSNKKKFWIGFALTIPGLIAASVVFGAMGALLDVLDGSSGAYGVASLLTVVMILVAFGVGIGLERTRYFALGVLAGCAVLLILAAGACVALIVSFNNSYN